MKSLIGPLEWPSGRSLESSRKLLLANHRYGQATSTTSASRAIKLTRGRTASLAGSHFRRGDRHDEPGSTFHFSFERQVAESELYGGADLRADDDGSPILAGADLHHAA